jgi:transglutaminase-like putative cysteine protease
MGNIKFHNDIVNVETLQEAWNTVILRYGDCDDFSILEASLLESIGIKTRFMVGSDRPDKVLCHIWIEAETNIAWVPLDASQGLPVGMEAKNLTFKKEA